MHSPSAPCWIVEIRDADARAMMWANPSVNEELRSNNADSARQLARNAVSTAKIGVVITLALVSFRMLL